MIFEKLCLLVDSSSFYKILSQNDENFVLYINLLTDILALA